MWVAGIEQEIFFAEGGLGESIPKNLATRWYEAVEDSTVKYEVGSVERLDNKVLMKLEMGQDGRRLEAVESMV